MNDLPRPPRSLRDRKSALNEQNVSNDITNQNISNQVSSSYLEETETKQLEINNNSSNNNTNIDDDEPVPIIQENNKKEKPKVTVLNVRKKSTKDLKEEIEKKQKEIEQVNKNLNNTIKKELEKVEEVVEEAKEEIEKVKQKAFEKISNISYKITSFVIKTSEKIVDKSKELILSLIFKKRNTKKKVLILYSDLVKKNIEFLDYQNKPFVKKEDINSPNFDKIFLANVKKDIKFCERFVRNIAPNKKGIYANRSLSDIFKNITDKDIYTFIEYVYYNPDNFIEQKYRFSEAFATWIVKKSHEI